jgi:uncharacterized protein
LLSEFAPVLTLSAALALVLTAGVEDCKTGCATRANQCRVNCRSQPLRELCFTICKNDETECKGDCGMGIDQSKQRGVQIASLASLETKCSSGNGRACLRAAQGWFTGRDGTKDENKAATLLNAACSRREADACAAIGDMQLDGRVVPKNVSTGLDSLEKSCEWGSPLGCYFLARTLESGRGGKTDVQRAKKLYTESCSGEFGPACFALGALLEKPGPNQDVEKAESYTERACDLDDAGACDALCLKTRRPEGAPDGLASLAWCAKACNGQVMSACTSEALMLLSGPPFKPNPRRARELLDAACDGTDARACWLLGEALERGSYGWKKSTGDAKRAFERAALIVEGPCRKGDGPACSLASLLAVEGRGGPAIGAETRGRLEPMCGKDDASGCASLGLAWQTPACGAVSATKAMEVLQLGCQSKSQLACRRLATLLQSGGEGVPADPSSAATLFETACDDNDGVACHSAARLYGAGTGVAKDVKKAKVLAKKGCKLGEKDACKFR